MEMYTFRDLLKANKKSIDGPTKRIAIIGNCATQFISQTIEGYAKLSGINLSVYDADYNQIDAQLLDPSSETYKYQPDSILLWICTDKIYEEFLDLDLYSRQQFAEEYIHKIERYWGLIANNSNAHILQPNFTEIDDKVIGQYSAKTDPTFTYQIRKLNYLLEEAAAKNPRVYFVDLLAIQIDMGRELYYSPKLYYSSLPISI